MKRLLLSGYYGYGNAGDEAVLAGLVAGFRAAAADGEIELTALSGQPAETRTLHGIGASHRYRPAALLPAIARCDLFLSGGGSLLQDVSSAHGIFYYLGVVRLAQMLGKRTMFLAQGLGPLTLARSRRLVASVANRLSAITVRDPASALLLAEIGVTRPSVEVTADPALLLSRSPFPGRDTRDASFGISLRPWMGHDNIGVQAAAACERGISGLRPLLFSMQPGSDGPVMEQFARKWPLTSGRENNLVFHSLKEGFDPLLSAIAGCEMMVGMRLHALILAAAAGVPSVALSYDPKVSAFMQGSGQADAVYDLAAPNWDTLPEMLARVWSERAARAEALRAVLPGLRAQAARNTEIALNLVRDS